MAFDTLMVVLLILGFGFVIFFHELGHFLAAKWVGIKVEQFAVGFGQALIAWRKGIGFRVGTTQHEYNAKIEAYIAEKEAGEPELKEKGADPSPEAVLAAEKALGLGETEYRLNWIPLGGYVKMLGQDDLKANAQQDDPRAYNRKSISARMLVVSAGVVMNVILAAIGFIIVFLIGFKVPGPRVGGIFPDSPAQRAGVHVNDVILYLDGKRQWDFTKVGLNAALLESGVAVPIVVERDHKQITLQITPGRMKGGANEFLSLGIEPARDLRGPKDAVLSVEGDPKTLVMAEDLAVKPGDVITAINGVPVSPSDFPVLDTAVQESFGKPIVLSVKNADGKTADTNIYPHFEEPFSAGTFHLAGMVPRARVMSVMPKSPARGILLPGDVVVALKREKGDLVDKLNTERLTKVLAEAGEKQELVTFTVIHDGATQPVELPPIKTGFKIEGTNKHGLGVALGRDEFHAVVADVLNDTPAYRAKLPSGDVTVIAIGDTPVSNWFDMHRALLAAPKDSDVVIHFKTATGDAKPVTVHLDADQWGAIHSVRYTAYVQGRLDEPAKDIRKASNPLEATAWGIGETRDFILQFYLTLRRMIGGSVSPSNMMGPIGIFSAGTKIAFKGTDWLIWFLSMISANLAVVNFLPIPIVDGGLFTFLVLEKIQGRPLSPRVQAIAQYAGLAFLAGVFLFVTYHDITRWF